MGLLKSLAAQWSQYKYRFLPWLALNLQSQRIQPAQQTFAISPDEEYVQHLKILFRKFSRPQYELLFRDNVLRRDNFCSLSRTHRQVVLDESGFILTIRDSLIPGAGRGVFVTEGRVREGQLVALYPGCVYQPSQPILLQSLGNPYILR